MNFPLAIENSRQYLRLRTLQKTVFGVPLYTFAISTALPSESFTCRRLSSLFDWWETERVGRERANDLNYKAAAIFMQRSEINSKIQVYYGISNLWLKLIFGWDSKSINCAKRVGKKKML